MTKSENLDKSRLWSPVQTSCECEANDDVTNSRRIICSCTILLNSLINIAAKGKFWRRIRFAIAWSMNGHYVILRSKNNNKIKSMFCHWDLCTLTYDWGNQNQQWWFESLQVLFPPLWVYFGRKYFSGGVEDRYLLCLISKINKLSDWN